MKTLGVVKRGAYFDSVTLMGVAKTLTGMPGVRDASVVMGTDANKGILKSAGLYVSRFGGAGDSDLLVAVKAATPPAAEAALAAADRKLTGAARKVSESVGRPVAESLDSALALLPGAKLALISIAGRYAGLEARRALEAGLHVMLFSDNVSIETEVELKQLGRRKGLLVMGPDAGTAILNGVPLAFANAVSRGPVGIVAASGTGAQEVSTLLSNEGVGISQLIGVGSRDVKKEVGGIMFREALKALAGDPATRVIVLISKPPDPAVLRGIRRDIARSGKPAVSLMLGAEAGEGEPRTLEEAAALAAALARKVQPSTVWDRLRRQQADLQIAARRAARRLRPEARFVRGLFSGGTFCAEAQLLLGPMLGTIYSNSPAGMGRPIGNSLHSRGHCFIDLGDDEFTQGRPHPMIDFRLRTDRIVREAEDDETAVLLLDVVLGYGAHPDPAGELAPAIRKVTPRCAVVCSVTGTDADPQNRTRVMDALRRAGALVASSNASACVLAGWMVTARKQMRARRE